MTTSSAVLRILMGIVVLAVGIAAGYMKRSPWIIAPMGLSFAILYILGKLKHFQHGLEQVGWKGMIVAMPATFAVQWVLAGLLYFIGLGFGYLIDPVGFIQPFSRFDLIYSLVTLVGIGFVAGIIAWLERKGPGVFEQAIADMTGIEDQDGWPYIVTDLQVHSEKLSIQSLFDGPASLHACLNEAECATASLGSDLKINQAEERLNIVLPDTLKLLYQHQNGGAISDVWAALSDRPFSNPQDVPGWIGLFLEKRDIVPTEYLEFLPSNLNEHVAAGEIEAMPELHEDASRFLVISQWERKTLFLDYSQDDAPAVGCADFDEDDWANRVVYWPSFEIFFSILRREDYEEADDATSSEV